MDFILKSFVKAFTQENNVNSENLLHPTHTPECVCKSTHMNTN